MRALWIVTMFLAALILPATTTATALKLALPLGLQEDAAWIPEDNLLTAEKIALGKQLFWDRRWSRNGTVACVSCHDSAWLGRPAPVLDALGRHAHPAPLAYARQPPVQ